MRWALVVVCCITACGGVGDSGPVDTADIECRERPEDGTGYLQPICDHIVANLSSYEIDPNDLEIERIASGDVEPRATEPFDTAAYDWVHLSCCFTGDIAVLERSSGAVVMFVLGDM